MEVTFVCVWNFDFQFVPGIQNQNFPKVTHCFPDTLRNHPTMTWTCSCVLVQLQQLGDHHLHSWCARALSVTDLLGELQVHLRVTFSGVSVVTNCVNLNTSGE